MKRVSITIQYEDEKIKAIKAYLNKNKKVLEDELTKLVDSLYTKTVPATVREYLDMQSGSTKKAEEQAKKLSSTEHKQTTNPTNQSAKLGK